MSEQKIFLVPKVLFDFYLRRLEAFMGVFTVLIFAVMFNIQIEISFLVGSIVFTLLYFEGRKRGSFLNQGVCYIFHTDRIDMIVDGMFYRSFAINGLDFHVETSFFQTDIVFRMKLADFFGSDLHPGLARDIRKNWFELVIYNVGGNVDEVIALIQENDR